MLETAAHRTALAFGFVPSSVVDSNSFVASAALGLVVLPASAFGIAAEPGEPVLRLGCASVAAGARRWPIRRARELAGV